MATRGQDMITVRVPLAIRRRGGRKMMIASVACADAPTAAAPETPVANALGRAFRWRQLIESGAYLTVADLAAAERVSPSYCSRVLRLTLLAPDLIEALLEAPNGSKLTLNRLLQPFPVEWLAQRRPHRSE